MRKFILTLLSLFLARGVASAALPPPDIIRQQLVGSVPHYYVWGTRFVEFQTSYFKIVYILVIGALLAGFFLHYIIFGPKRFEEGGKKIKFFNVFNIIVHWIAAASFTLLIPTGLIIVYAKFFGGDGFVRTMRSLHDLGAALFAIVLIPLFAMWVKDMFLHPNDFKWLSTGGGYFTKQKIETGACKFNPGQKFWFWVATLLGAFMLATGAAMFFQQFKQGIFKYQIDLLRFAAIAHNVAAVVILAMFLVHLYMSLFVVKGSLRSMLTGYKSEDEVKYLHSSFYKKYVEKQDK